MRTKRQVILCLVVLGCCALKMAALQAHKVTSVYETKCKITHYDAIKARQK